MIVRPRGATASFFETIEPVISGTLSTVAVTSRTKNSLRSAGARSSVGPITAQPTSFTTRANRSIGGAV